MKRAKRFSQELQEVSQWLDDEHKPTKAIWCEHVSGDMPTIERRNKLKRLKEVGENEVGLLSNARCLSEGVDVPALDGVAFIDAKSSEIDIVQAVGRAIRLSAKKEMGTIVIPVFIERHEDPEEAVASSNFKPIWDVLDALKSHDDVLPINSINSALSWARERGPRSESRIYQKSSSTYPLRSMQTSRRRFVPI